MPLGRGAISRRTAFRGALAAAASVACASCLFSDAPTPPLPDTVQVEVFADEVSIDLLNLDNQNDGPLEVCLTNVVVQPAGGGPTCSFAGVGTCLVLQGHTAIGRAPFHANGPCGVAPGRVRVLADVRYRPRPPSGGETDEAWQTTTMLTDARAVVGAADARQSRR
jgi:hypothetical protein